MERFAKKLKALRHARGWTQEELAQKSGINRGYLARLETGYHDPTLTTVQILARALRVKIARLVE